MKLKPLSEESLLKKLAISFFFMSLVPILVLIYIVKIIGFDVLINKLPYIRLTIIFIVCLVSLVFIFLRYSLRSISYVMKTAKGIAGGNYEKRIDIKETDEIGQLARSFNKITGELESKIKELEESKNIIQGIFKKVGMALTSAEGIGRLLELVIETIVKGVSAEKICIMLLDKKNNELKIKVSYGIDEKVAKKASVKIGEGIIGLSAKEKRAIISSYTETPGASDRDRLYYKTIISVPLLYKEDCLGVLAVFDKKNSVSFEEDDMVLISNIASQTAVAIANAKLNEDAEQTYIETITALAMAVEAKDPYSRGHLDRVSRLVVGFGKHLGLSEKTIEILENGAELHDLGKIGVRDEVLRKKEPLREQEQKELQKHVIIGENIIRPIKKLAPLCDIVRHHQEWWNGTGYPDRLKGEEIPLTARILKVVDAYDAMATDRPYRKALAKEEIKEQFRKGSGKEFDPKLVEKFLEII
ncbi:MAG: HD domain-containing protein [Candidatus Omnitrophota bacterium]|nr:MAG: HD domain-containing protein [Candidatus Omnitrophota bacterium]